MTFHNLWIQARSGRSSSRKGPVGGADLFTFATSTVNTRMVPRGGVKGAVNTNLRALFHDPNCPGNS